MQSISYILSPAVAAFLYSVCKLNAIIAIDVLGAIVASITVAFVRIPKPSMEYFKGTPTHVSITEIAYASGMLVGGMLLGLLGDYKKRIILITASIFMMGASLAIAGLLPPGEDKGMTRGQGY